MRHFKFVFKQLQKRKTFTIINVLGLSIAIITSLVLLLYVKHHYNFDKTINNRDRSYRIVTGVGKDGTMWASTFAAFDKIIATHPDVEKSAALYANNERLKLGVDGNVVEVQNTVFTNSGFFDFFNIQPLLGNPIDLNSPNTVIITESCAKILFGNQNPVGKTISITRPTNEASKRVSTVVGVIPSKTENSHLKYDFIHSKKGFYEETIERIEKLKVFGAYVYFTIKPNIDPNELKSQFPELLTPMLGKSPGPPIKGFVTKLQPISEIHFNTSLNRDFSIGVERSMLNILFVIALLILLVAVFNSLVMNIARGEERANLTKIIQVLGGNKRSVFKIGFVESGTIVICSLIIALTGVVTFVPYLSTRYLNNWEIDFQSYSFWGILLVLGGVVIVFSSFFGNISLLNFNRKVRLNPTSFGNKRVIPLIVFQFIIVIGIISYGMLLRKQLNYIKNKELGYSTENIMIYNVPERSAKINIFKEEAKKMPGIISVANVNHYPGFRLQDVNLKTKDESFPFKFAIIEEEAMELLGVNIKEKFSEISNKSNYINQSMYNALNRYYSAGEIRNGDFNPEHEEGDGRVDFKIAGVIEDFHYESLYNTIGNFSFYIRKSDNFNHRFVLIKFQQKNVAEVKSQLAGLAKSIYNSSNFEPTFLNDELNQKYKSEELLLSTIKLFSVLTICIVCMGLIAFTVFAMQQRTKEIGIRKVNGAKVSEILTMLNRDFIKWVAIAFIIACPIAYYAMNKWLENFAYKTTLSWWIFALAGVLALCIALLTVSWQSWRAATRNPVEALRYE